MKEGSEKSEYNFVLSFGVFFLYMSLLVMHVDAVLLRELVMLVEVVVSKLT